MSTANPSAGRERNQGLEDLDDVRGGWGLFLGVGALTILLGFGLIVSSFVLGGSYSLVFGWIILITGVVQLAGAFVARGWIGSVAAVTNGLLQLGIAVTLFSDHAGEVSGLMLAVAGLVFTAGMCRVGLGLIKRYTHREISLFNGAAGMVIGLMVGAAWYGGQMWAIGSLLGVDIMITGAAWVLFAVLLRRVQEGRAGPVGAR